MEQLSSCVAERMINLDIISRDDKDCYCYSVQCLLEKTVCLLMIILMAVIINKVYELLAFLWIFALIRRSSDGFHCKSSVGCFFSSTIMTLSTIGAVRLIYNCAICLGGVVCAMIILCIIATYNNPDMNLTEEELNHLKKRSRIVSAITGGFIIILILIFPRKEIVYYLALGVIYNAVSLLIAIITERRKQSYEEEQN